LEGVIVPAPETKDPTTAFAEELAKQIPVKAVYKDAVKPAAKQLGEIGQDIIKTIQLALAPLQFAGAYQDRLRRFIEKSVRSVPEERRISPPPQILGPVVEGVRYEEEGTPIDDLFRNLLSSSMDSVKNKDAHPAFPLLIKQLSADEATILVDLQASTYPHVATQDFDRTKNLFFNYKIEQDGLPKGSLRFADNVPFYMEHLDKLGLAGVYQDGNQEPLFNSGPTIQTGIRIKSKYRLTSFGERFVRACT
jgi:hypothetical protein